MIPSVFEQELKDRGIEYKTDFCLKRASTFRIGGVCKCALFPKNEQELVACISLLDDASEKFFVCGRGSNTLFFDGYIDKTVVFTAGVDKVEIDGKTVTAQAGAMLMPLCARLGRVGLGGLEFACGIPASVGGAVYMNAGAHGGAVSDVITLTQAYDRKKQMVEWIRDNGFGYRKSVYSQSSTLVCLGAKFELEYADSDAIKTKMESLLETRRKSQPLEYPSAGSYFKRPDGDFSGRLIEISGLKGARIGGAEVSQKHAGFIINVGEATFEDVTRLEELVKETVYKKTGVQLTREVEIVR